MARGGRVPCAQRRSQHRVVAGLHDRPIGRDRAGVRAIGRHAHDRRHLGRVGAVALGMVAGGLSHLPGHRHRRCAAGHPGGDCGAVPHHRHAGNPGRHVGRPGRLCRYHRDRLGLRGCGEKARRDRDRAQSRAGADPTAGRAVGRDDRAGQHRRRARRQCGGALGQAGRPHGRSRSAAVADGAPLPTDRDNPGHRRPRPRTADDRRSRRLHLHAAGPEGPVARHL